MTLPVKLLLMRKSVWMNILKEGKFFNYSIGGIVMTSN